MGPSSLFRIVSHIGRDNVLLSGPVLALEDGRRDGGLAIEKRERRDDGFGMEVMERRGVVLKWRRGRGETVVLEWR